MFVSFLGRSSKVGMRGNLQLGGEYIIIHYRLAIKSPLGEDLAGALSHLSVLLATFKKLFLFGVAQNIIADDF